MTESMTFLIPSLIFCSLLVVASLTLLLPGKAKRISFVLLLVNSLVMGWQLFLKEKFQLTAVFSLELMPLQLARLMSFFSLVVTFLNGSERRSAIRNSLLSQFIFFAAIFVLGAQEFVSFFIAVEMMSLIGYAQVAVGGFEFSKEASVKYFIQGLLVSVFFLLGISFFFAATNSFLFTQLPYENMTFYVLASVLFCLVIFFKMGAFPFHSWVPEVYPQVDLGVLATNILLHKVVMGFSFLVLLKQMSLLIAEDYRTSFQLIILTVALLSAFYGNIIALTRSHLKKVLSYSSVAHGGYMLMTIVLWDRDSYSSELTFYLVFYAIAATGAFLLVNFFLKSEDDKSSCLKAGFAKNPLAAVLLSFFTLSLAGIPFTAGFVTKYLLFTSYYRHALLIPAFCILVSSIIALGYYIRFIQDLFTGSTETKISMNPRLALVSLVFGVIILVGGVYPSLFLSF